MLSTYAKNSAPMNIKRLELYNNMSGDEGAIEIASVLQCCPLLEVFRWASNRSNEAGALALCESLKLCPCMKRLELKDNYFGEDGGEPLSRAIECMPNLKELILADLMIEEEGLVPVFQVIKDKAIRLRLLDVSLNCMTTEAISQLIDTLPEQEELEELLMGGNYLGSELCCVGSESERQLISRVWPSAWMPPVPS